MTRTILAAAIAAAAFMLTPDASASDFRAEVGAAGTGTTWRGDGAATGSTKLAFRFADIAGPYVNGSVGYGTVDDRLLTCVGIGGQVWGTIGGVRPYGRLGFIHQHEESLSVVAGDFGSALLGIGDGIRHRAGGELGAGVELPFFQSNALGLYASIDANVKLFPDDLGPLLYAGGGVSLGLSYAL